MKHFFLFWIFIFSFSLFSNDKLSDDFCLFEPAKIDFHEFSTVRELQDYVSVSDMNKSISNSGEREVLLNKRCEYWKRYFNPHIIPPEIFIKRHAGLFPAIKTNLKEDLVLISYIFSKNKIMVVQSTSYLILFVRPYTTVKDSDTQNLESINKLLDFYINRKGEYAPFYPPQFDNIIESGKFTIIEGGKSVNQYSALKAFISKNAIAIKLALPQPARHIPPDQAFSFWIKRAQEPKDINQNPTKLSLRPKIQLSKIIKEGKTGEKTKLIAMFEVIGENGKCRTRFARIGDTVGEYEILDIMSDEKTKKFSVKAHNEKTNEIMVFECSK